MAGDSTTAVYFPNFAPNDDWLKYSLLYWDNVQRIIPKNSRKKAFEEDSQFCTEARKAELLNAIDTVSYRDKAWRRYIAEVQPLFQGESKNAERWFRNMSKTKPVKRDAGNVPSGKTRPRGGERHQWLAREKFPSAITNELDDLGIMHVGDHFVEMSNFAGDLYMTCLAKEIGKTLKAPVFTDDNDLSAGSEHIVIEDRALKSEHDDRRRALIRLGIRYPVPAQLENVTFDDVYKFRDKFFHERVAFRSTLEDFLKSLSEADNADAQNSLVASKRMELKKLMKEHRSSLAEFGAASGWALLTITVPKWIASLPAVVAPHVYVPALAVGGMALGAAACWSKIQKDKRERSGKNPWHYAWRVGKLAK